MAHITFIHGIENKPPGDELLNIWRESLRSDGGIDLAAEGITSSMVYWADVLYSDPLEMAVAESVMPAEVTPDSPVVQQLAESAQSADEALFLAGVAGKLSVASMTSAAALAVEEPTVELAAGDVTLERVPIPWVLKEPLMALLLRDVHHYLFDTEFSPRPGTTYHVQAEIRRRFVKALRQGGGTPPHIVVSHSMGTVIAYDCLLRAEGCPAVDGLMTIGSPLGLDEIQDKMQPEWTRRAGFPPRVQGTWANVFDPLDPVAGFEPYLANDFQRDGRNVILDINESNWGWWRHDIAKYLAGAGLRDALSSMLRGSGSPARTRTSVTEAVEVTSSSTGSSEGPGWISYESIARMLGPVVADGKNGDVAVAAEITGDGNVEMRAPILSDISEKDREFLPRIAKALDKLRKEADEHGHRVMSSPSDAVASLIQSAAHRRAVTAVATFQEMPFDSGDTKSIIGEVKRQMEDLDKHPQKRPSSDKPTRISNRARIFLVSDFGTGLYAAPLIADRIAKGPSFDVLMHLGDVYYTGQPDEIESRVNKVWPFAAGEINRTLLGNHEMYSKGYGYFDVALPAFGQESSYFAMQNDDWLLVALDTAHKDNNLGKTQLEWVLDVCDHADNRRVILLSHHPLFSNFKEPGTKLEKKLRKLLKSKRVAAWYWGHEHHAVIYDRYTKYDLLGRCLGNGAMPSDRAKVSKFPVERNVGPVSWLRGTSLVTPSGLYLDGPNPAIRDNPQAYGPHGYMTLEFNGDEFTESVFIADGTLVFQNTVR